MSGHCEGGVGFVSRIALYIANLDGGGAERVFVHLANGFVRRGYGTDLLLSQARGPFLELLDDRIRVTDLGSYNTWNDVRPLAKYLRRQRPASLLSALTTTNVAAVMAGLLASNGRTRVVVSEHAHPSMVTRATGARSRHVLPLLMRLFYPCSYAVVTVSESVRGALLETYKFQPDHVRTIYNPMITEGLPILARESVEHPWFNEGTEPVIVAVGRLIGVKDFPTLLDAFSVVNRTRRARLVIIGEGEERDSLLKQAHQLGVAERVEIMSFDINPFRYMKRAAVHVLSSVSEALPSVLIEAMACGAKVVATDCDSGPREILQDGKYGTLVPVGDHVALARAIVTALDAPSPSYPEELLLPYAEDYAVERYLEVMGLEKRVG